MTDQWPERSASGWGNYCQHCLVRYWVRSVDINQPKMRRFTGPESNERHVCEGTK